MALVRKILEATIPSGGSSATFTDSDIPNSLIRVYSTNSNIYPQNISLSGNTLTVTYEVVSSALGVAVELVKQGLEIDDNLTSDNTDHALSAKQGKVLKGLIDGLNIPDNISELQDVDITDIEDEQVLAWDETAQKFVNVDQSGGSSINYSTTEHVIGTWYDGSTLYEKTFIITNNLPPAGGWGSIDISSLNLAHLVKIDGFTTWANGFSMALNTCVDPVIYSGFYLQDNDTIGTHFVYGSSTLVKVEMTLQYTKSV